MSRWTTMVFAIFAALSSSGCATLGSIQRANTIGKGNWQGGIEPGVKGISTDGQVRVSADMAASIRAGVSDRVDLGGRIGQNFYDIHMKYQLTETDSSGPIVSFAPSFSILGLPWDGGVFLWGQVNLPVLIGVPVGQSQIIFGPRLMDSFFGAAFGGEGGGSTCYTQAALSGSRPARERSFLSCLNYRWPTPSWQTQAPFLTNPWTRGPTETSWGQACSWSSSLDSSSAHSSPDVHSSKRWARTCRPATVHPVGHGGELAILRSAGWRLYR